MPLKLALICEDIGNGMARIRCLSVFTHSLVGRASFCPKPSSFEFVILPRPPRFTLHAYVQEIARNCKSPVSNIIVVPDGALDSASLPLVA